MATTAQFEYLLRTLPVSEAAENRDGKVIYLVKFLALCHTTALTYSTCVSVLGIYSLAGGVELAPSVRSKLDFPLQLAEDTDKKKKFIVCEINRSGTSYRSPWSNKYFPPLPDETVGLPSEKTRKLEEEANELFESYKDQYYMGGVPGTSSAYFKDTGTGFTAYFLIKKTVEEHEYVQQGVWDSVNVVHALMNEAGTDATYKLSTTVMLNMGVSKSNVGATNISGLLTRQSEVSSKVDATKTPMSVIGRMIEDMETDIR
jgi:capping protein beta